MTYLKKIITTLQVIVFLSQPLSALAAENKLENIKLEDIALPSEFKDLPKSTGAIYYSSTSKNKILVPVHLWGHLVRPGLHFLPSDSTFIKGLSATGGPLPGANLSDIRLTRIEGGKSKTYNFNLSEGGDEKAQNFVIQSGDVVFVKQDKFLENRIYYTSLVSIVISVLTGVILYRQIQTRR